MLEDLETRIIVVKRDGKKVAFNGTKIAVAIKKGFDSVEPDLDSKQVREYDEDDVNKVYTKVIHKINGLKKDRIKIEEIQDMIEEELKINNYMDVYQSFSEYRENRAQSREIFFDEKRKHKFLKALEELGLKQNHSNIKKENILLEENSARGTILEYGNTVSREFAKSYLMKKKFADCHDNGDIYIHDMSFLPMGTTTTCQIELDKLFEDGFTSGKGYMREPQNIMSYSVLAVVAMLGNQSDQHGSQSIPAFDYYMATGVLRTFKKEFRQVIYDLLEYTDFDKFIAINGIEREIDRINTIDYDIKEFDKFSRGSEEIKRLFRISYEKALKKTDKIVYQAMEAFIHNLNTLYVQTGKRDKLSSINFGTDTSSEGRMVMKNLLHAIDEGIGNNQIPTVPTLIFKVKKGINLEEKDINYDIFELAMAVTNKKSIISYSFLDATFNEHFYKEGDYNTEVAYTPFGMRVLDNFVDEDKAVTGGRGNLSYTTINLPRLGIKHGIVNNTKNNIDGFFEELEEKIDLVKDQLLERFEIQGNKKKYNFPFLMKEHVWIDSDRLKPDDKIKKALKQGTLSISFVGLEECLVAMTGKTHLEDKDSQKLGIQIINKLRQKADEYSDKYNLTFTIAASPMHKTLEEFNAIDQAIYGKIKGITDKDQYTNSFQISKGKNVSIEDKIKTEAPYHELTNGGHITFFELKKVSEEQKNIKKIKEVINLANKNNMGYISIKMK